MVRTTARAYGHYFPETIVDGVEIDPELEEVGREYFDMGSNPNLTVHNEDARPWRRRSEGDYDVILVDAYRQPYIPFYLATKEFFELASERLAPGGLVVLATGMKPAGQDLPVDSSFIDGNGFFISNGRGIVGCGVNTGPKDVAAVVQEATGAVLKAIRTLKND